MQGQRDIVGSLPGSTTGTALIDEQVLWNNMRNPAENQLADLMLSTSHASNTYVGSIHQEQQNLSRWSLGEPSSNSVQIGRSNDEQKTDNGQLSSSSVYNGAYPMAEGSHYEQTNIHSIDSVIVNAQCAQSSSSDVLPLNINLNAEFLDPESDNCQVVEAPNLYKSSQAENEWIPPAGGSNPFLHPSGGDEYIREENDGRPGCSSDSHRRSCKRKAVEGNIGQSSISGSSSFFQHQEYNSWPSVPARNDTGSSSSIFAPTEPADSRLALGVRGLASDSIPVSGMATHAESTQRNLRLRINPSNQESVPSLFSTRNAVRHSSMPSSDHSSRHLPVGHSLDFRSSPSIDATAPHSHPVVLPVPAFSQNVSSVLWNESSSSRASSSSSSISLGDGVEANSRNVARNMWTHPMFIAASDLRTSVRNPAIRSVTGGQLSVPGNVASESRVVSSSDVQRISVPSQTWVPHPNPPSRNSRRLADFARRSLSPLTGAVSGVQSSTHSQPHSGPPVSSEVLSSGVGAQSHHRSYPRSAQWMERQVDGAVGIPYPLLAAAGGNEGRSRHVMTERVRNVLDLMRRGENLRLEDVMLIDQSVYFGAADIHDRHRDMRLDVDNMSYEELLALEERIGNVNTGLSEETILKRLNRRKYSCIPAGAEVDAEPCCICREEYEDGEDIGTLDCSHDFHSGCIKQWLMLKNWCPICRTTGLNTGNN